ncbi:FHA domain-containing protein [Streptomyces wedmorensis]
MPAGRGSRGSPWVLRDLGSTNGTTVNGRRVTGIARRTRSRGDGHAGASVTGVGHDGCGVKAWTAHTPPRNRQ